MITVTDKHVFFFTEWPSNFKLANFRCDTTNTGDRFFFCTEQAFMYAKAMTFSDYDTAEKIMKVKTPQEAKDLGRKVSPYSEDIWSRVRYDHMYKANYAKYQQNPDLLKLLLDPQFDGKTFVEASPWDTIWGIALSRKDYSIEYIDDENHWRGQNLLGKAITEVRSNLLKNGYCINFDCPKNDSRGLCEKSKNEYCRNKVLIATKPRNPIIEIWNRTEALEKCIKDIQNQFPAGSLVGDQIRNIIESYRL